MEKVSSTAPAPHYGTQNSSAADRNEKSLKNRIVQGFRRFYKFFRTGSVVISIIVFVIWMFACAFNWMDTVSGQYTNGESYARGAVQNMASTGFNPHWGFLLAAILILIFGRFLSYISAAFGLWVERMKDEF